MALVGGGGVWAAQQCEGGQLHDDAVSARWSCTNTSRQNCVHAGVAGDGGDDGGGGGGGGSCVSASQCTCACTIVHPAHSSRRSARCALVFLVTLLGFTSTLHKCTSSRRSARCALELYIKCIMCIMYIMYILYTHPLAGVHAGGVCAGGGYWPAGLACRVCG